MEDPGRFGAELADRTVARMETEALDSTEAALLAAQEILKWAERLIAAGGAREVTTEWTEAVMEAYDERLNDRIRASREMAELPRGKQ